MSVATQPLFKFPGSQGGELTVVKRKNEPSTWGDEFSSMSASKIFPVLKLNVVVVSAIVSSAWSQHWCALAQVLSARQGSEALTMSRQATSRKVTMLLVSLPGALPTM